MITTSHFLVGNQHSKLSDYDNVLKSIGHPAVVKAYADAKMLDEYEPSPQDVAEWRFEQKRKANAELRRQIDQLFRVKVGSKEYILYHETQITTDILGNTIRFPKLRGRYQLPEFTKRFESEVGQAVPEAVSGTKTVYEYPWSKEKAQEILDLDTEGTETALLTMSGSTRYSQMWSVSEFLTRSFEDLVHKGRTGVYPESASAKSSRSNPPPSVLV